MRDGETGAAGTRPLGELKDFEVADGDPDVRGWTLADASGEKIGTVRELLIDVSAMRVRYLEVELDSAAAGGATAGARRALVPIGAARITDDRVVVNDVNALSASPDYDQASFDRSYERKIVGGYLAGTGTAAGATAGTAGTAADASDERFYESEHFDDEAFYGKTHGTQDMADEARVTRTEEELAIGKRTVERGSVGVRKRVETEHVAKDVPVVREEVTVERRPVTDRTAPADIRAQELNVPVREEQVVAEKRAVVKEEIVVRTDTVQGTERVEADVRRERVDVVDTTTDATRDTTRRDPNAR